MRKNLLATLLACLALGGTTLHATTLYWSGDGTTQGGPGTWNTTLARWGTSTSGPFTTVWNNANTDSAIIDNGTGAGGSIVIGAAITMRGTLTLNGSGGTYPAYTINGASAMTFAAGSTLTTAMNRIMSCPYSGTITKAGAGMVTFNNGNGSVTKFILTAGTADFASPNRMPGTDVSDFITLNGGKLRGSTVAWGSFGKSITVGASGGTIFGSSSSVAMTADKPITSTGSGRLTIDNSTFTLSNTNNNWAGPMTVSSGILTLGAAGVIPDTCAVTLSGGDLATGGFAETIDTLIVTSSGSAITGVGPLTVNTLIDLRASSTIGTTVIAGAANASKTTTGMATLTGANTYSGGTALSAGVLRVGNNSALGTGKLTLVSGRLSGNSSTARTLSVPVDLSGNVTLGTNTVDTGNLTFQTGAWTITGATRTITTDTNTISINSAIGEDAPGRGLIKAGAIGILALNNPANTYSGDTTISAGTINVDGDGSFGNGAGAINLAGGNIGVTADRGVSSANIINRVNMTANAEIMAATATGTRNIVFGGVWTTTSGTLTLHSTQVGVGPATLNVRFTNAFTFSQPITFAVDTAGNFVNLDVWNRADLGDQTYNGLISGPGSIKRSISTAGTGGKVTFTQQNTYSGGTSLNDGEIALGSDCTGSANAPTAGPLGTGTVTIGNDVGRLSASAASRNLFNRILFSATGTHLALLGSNDLELSGNVDLAGQSVTITNLNTGVARISGVIGNGALTKDGAGTLVLSGANTYAGTTTVIAGLLDAAVAGSLGTNSVNVASGATLQLDAVGAIGSSANLVLGSGTLPVNLNFAGVSNIRALSFDGGATFQDAGTWGATGSGATHIDDAHFAGAGQLSVALAGSITSLATDGSPSTYGNTVTFTATVTGTGGTPTGSVTFKDSASTIGSGVLNGSGVATLAIASLPAGARSITAVYAGDGTFVGSTSSAVTQTVNQAVLTVTATGVLVYGNDPTNAVYTPFYTGPTNSDTTNVIP
ncbi:MAG: Ig-like domain repeat protein, partial [Verrucomicrobia bacterium]|nr:Ig-like domain repeat protein [Verrucomicrobiota bacterium]